MVEKFLWVVEKFDGGSTKNTLGSAKIILGVVQKIVWGGTKIVPNNIDIIYINNIEDNIINNNLFNISIYK